MFAYNIQLQKTIDKEEILKETREMKNVLYIETSMRIIVGLQSETMQTRELSELFKMLKKSPPHTQNYISSQIIQKQKEKD